MTTTLYYGLLSLYASSSLYGSITSLYAQTSLYNVTTTLYDVDDFARRRFTLTPFRELLYTCRDYRTCDHHHHHHHRHYDVSSSISIIIIIMIESSIESGFLIYFHGRLVLFGCSRWRPPWDRYCTIFRKIHESFYFRIHATFDPVSYWHFKNG